MNLKHLIFGFAALTTLGLASCSNDMQEGPEAVGSKQTRYVQVQISGADDMNSRADDYATATPEENQVNDILFLFYDQTGKRTGSPVLVSNPQFVDATTPDAPNVGKVLSSVVGVEMDANDTPPAFVMAFLNPARNSAGVTNYQDMTLTELNVAFTTNVINEQNCFLMSNSVFFKEDGNLQVATPIAENQLFKTIEAAQNADAANITHIYVERYAAKVVVNLRPEAIQEVSVVDATGAEQKLVFTPTQWFINNSDYFVFRTKTFGKAEISGTVGEETINFTPASYADANTALGNGAWTWNDPAHSRSYWACSPSYYASVFPLSADNVINKQAVDGETQDYMLDYFTWNAQTNPAWNSAYGHTPNPIIWDATAGFDGKAAYPFETTASERAVNYNKTNAGYVSNPRAAIASVAITGTYTIGDAAAPATFYLYGLGDGNRRVLYTEANIKDPFLAIQNVIYRKVGTTYTIVDAESASAPLFEVKHPDWEVLKENKDIISEGMVTLQLTGENLGDDLYYLTTDGEKQQITGENYKHVNSKLITNLGTAEAFVGGKAWFNIPVRHLGFDWNTTDGSCKLEGSNNSYDWSKVHTAYFGLVRNHVYTLNVNSISGVGYGVVDEDNPLVPPVELDTYYIAYSLKILNWRVVPAQDVDL